MSPVDFAVLICLTEHPNGACPFLSDKCTLLVPLVRAFYLIVREARRWVVERTHSWMNRFRRLLMRWTKKPANYLGQLQFACGLIAYRAAGLFA